MVRNVELGRLLACYGDFLTARQALLLHMHANEDLSLAEIAEQTGISRQGVHDALKRGENQLRHMEDTLGLLRKEQQTTRTLQELNHEAEALALGQKERQWLMAAHKRIADIWEEEDGV